MTQDAHVLIHVQFAPNGGVTNIGQQPAGVTPQHWFNALSLNAGNTYQPLAGGRGVFRLTGDEVARFQQLVA